MECGCCSYVCPARRPLVENNKLAKAALRKYQAEKDGGKK
jgi:electron transport complex protein RnfC